MLEIHLIFNRQLAHIEQEDSGLPLTYLLGVESGRQSDIGTTNIFHKSQTSLNDEIVCCSDLCVYGNVCPQEV